MSASSKKFRFPPRIRKVNVPFMLNDFSPWQDQIHEALEKTRERMGTSKRARYGYRIENGFAEIYITKHTR